MSDDAEVLLLRQPGVVPLHEDAAVFSGMLDGFSRQQTSRGLATQTIQMRRWQVERFQRFADSYPWEWLPGDVEDFTTSLFSGPRPLARSTVRIYHLTLRAFCDFITDQRYGWVAECRSRFGSVPTQVCFEWNTVAHTVDFEGTPGRRPLDYDELEALFAVADARVETLRQQGRKGALAALRDAQLLKTIYAWGLRRREALGLDVVDLRTNAKTPQWGRFGLLHVRHGKSSKGSIPKRRSVLSLPEFDWAIDGLRVYVEQVREKFNPGNHPGLWPTERGTRVGDRYLDRRFAQLRDEAGLPGALTLHSLRHSYVTHLIELGYAEQFVQTQVGHAYASTTAIYTSVTDDYRNRVLAAAIDKFYFPEGST
ncbi:MULTISPECIES: tyrosine-type recombinase/integrase [Microbacterium]|uniref:tyrosine-type recombinase/integrase n=1 Tax=Microbacterium TaxID=33882 RepID=UPI00217E0313|nr:MULTISPECIES: tyrosine-type recombinase/integrase [Microbacterium]